MSIEVGSELTLEIEKPAVGGRMLARHHGQVVLVWGAIPGERVRARVERSGKGVLFAETTEVMVPSADRRDPGADWRCGGNVFAHVAYERQLRLKAEIIRESLGRIGRVPLAALPNVLPSPERGYRTRARLHARDGRLGFFREGSHHLCDAGSTGQLLASTVEWIAAAERTIADMHLSGLAGAEIAENIPGDERACHLELQGGVDIAPWVVLADSGSLTGLSASRTDRQEVEALAGVALVTDLLRVGGASGVSLTLRRSAQAFFQGNRFLLEPLVQHVGALVPPGFVVDLYAGVGLFGLSLVAAGNEGVTLVEGDPVSGADLLVNAEPFASRVRVEQCSVEAYLRSGGGSRGDAVRRDGTFIVDPPRTGLSKEAVGGILRGRPWRIVYISCDIATFSRDARALLDGGYELSGVSGFDLFPNTAHVETVAVFVR
jgi:23S rRNA (uracil1939-C5)-methyltransferase